MILVTGAAGNVGSEVVASLVRRGARVRALVRDGAAQTLPSGVDAVTGDLERPDTMAEALEGVQSVFLLPGYADMPEAIRAAGARRLVLLSGGSAGSGDMTNAITRYMAESEAAVRESGIASTVLRPASFMANALRWLPQLQAGDVVRLPFAGIRTACVDPFDIGAVAAASLLEEGHDGKIYVPTGPESLLPAEQGAILADVLGRDLRFEAQPDDEAREEMLKTTPSDYVDAFFDLGAARLRDGLSVLWCCGAPTEQTTSNPRPLTVCRA